MGSTFERKTIMQSEKTLDVVLGLYFLFLFTIVISKMQKEISEIDIIYFSALVCCALKLFLFSKKKKK